MQKLYPVDEKRGHSPLIKVKVIGDYNSLYKKCVKLKNLIDKFEAIKKTRKESGQRQKIRKYTCGCFCAREMDAEDHFINQINTLKM